MKKYIHYCWFGGKPLPKLAKKCIASWKKYLPDFEIKRWDETNCDINECNFVKLAYQNKKWAFVADYFRTKALKEFGGIYFDTDMEITKNIDKLLDDDTFLGVEDSGSVAVGVWWEKNPNSILTSYLLNFYQTKAEFNINKMNDFSIPKLVTEVLCNYDYDPMKIDQIQNVKGIVIYPRDYFYPLSYDRQNNLFTDNTCMIHYYDATWVPKWEQKEINYIRKYGKEKAYKKLKIENNIKKCIRKSAKACLFPVVLYHHKKIKENYLNDSYNEFLNDLENIKNNEYITVCNPAWLGTTQATKTLFINTVGIRDLENTNDYDKYIDKILEKKPYLVIFSAFVKNWEYIVEKLSQNNIRVKVLWHGSNAVHTEKYDFEVFKIIFDLLDKKKIESIGFVKKSMYQLYKELGYNVEFVKNTVHVDKISSKEKHNGIKIGLYASEDRWVKNFYNQLAGASLIKNAKIDVLPLSNKTVEFSKILKCNVTGLINTISHDAMLERLSKNDINVYATFVECAPIIPLESLELGVPCITGDNHHYWENTELEKYLVVSKVDNPIAIKDKIEYVLQNKDKIMELYAKWKDSYDIESKKSVEDFIK